MRKHFYDGPEDASGVCVECGQPYEVPGDPERHNYDKVWWIEDEQVHIRPYVKADYDREMAELEAMTRSH